MIVVFCGLPATGKSFLARNIAERIGAVHLNTDIIRRETIESPDYSDAEKKQVYEELMNRTRKLVSSEQDVVLDGTFYRKGLRNVVSDIAESASLEIFFVECRCDEETIKKRLEKRKKKIECRASDADNIEIYKLVEENFEPIEEQHLVIDCFLKDQEKFERVLKWIKPE